MNSYEYVQEFFHIIVWKLQMKKYCWEMMLVRLDQNEWRDLNFCLYCYINNEKFEIQNLNYKKTFHFNNVIIQSQSNAIFVIFELCFYKNLSSAIWQIFLPFRNFFHSVFRLWGTNLFKNFETKKTKITNKPQHQHQQTPKPKLTKNWRQSKYL